MDACATEDPMILSGTLCSTLDVFGEYSDAEIVSFHPLIPSIPQFATLCAVHLIPGSDNEEGQETGIVNANAFHDLGFAVSEGGDNFSAGEKQLLCMARAILKRSKVLVMCMFLIYTYVQELIIIIAYHVQTTAR
ncbi:hypothetical protein B0H10DRAFT_1950143 [Mycena sp. CBHHK59/15]|nr:hypothetical protein B0H10DRAFT_1950143 [Mycena sp. CBHHK59/15]